MTETVKSLFELVNERPDVDNSSIFEDLWHITTELRAKLDARFVVQGDASTADLQPYNSLDGGAKGFLSAFSGAEIDWLVHSYIGNPKHSFTNMHLTAWLGAQVRVPHFGMALGTMPDIFMYIDYVPRVDLMHDFAYMDRYYEPANARYLELHQHPDFSPFISKSLYMRQSQSQTSLCFLVKPKAENVALIRTVAHEMLDRWLGYVDSAEPVPTAERAALSERDLAIRREIADRDPANPIGNKLFGDALAGRLIRALWGGDRVNARAGV
jgi:hypothetical protein